MLAARGTFSRRRRRRPVSRIVGGTAAVVMVLFGCARGHESSTSSATRAPRKQSEEPAAQPSTPQSVRVGNQVGGVRDQPDYDAQAEAVRDTVDARLPDPLPDVAQACSTMLDDVVAHYRGSEDVARRLGQTRERDLRGCKERTSAAAAACVSILLEDPKTEYPRALDLCSRAYAK